MRKPIIAGNWKMNNTIAETKALVTELIPLVKDAKADVVICTPYTDLATAVEMTRGTNIHVGAENVHWAEKGAFTGEVSANMLVELGVEYVIIGHSERRQYFGETDQTVNARVKAALSKGLKPIICVGELLEEREAGKTEEVVVRRPPRLSKISTNPNLKTSSSHTNPYGQSAPAKPQPPTTRTQPSRLSATRWRTFIAETAPTTKYAFSTAAA